MTLLPPVHKNLKVYILRNANLQLPNFIRSQAIKIHKKRRIRSYTLNIPQSFIVPRSKNSTKLNTDFYVF